MSSIVVTVLFYITNTRKELVYESMLKDVAKDIVCKVHFLNNNAANAYLKIQQNKVSICWHTW